MTEGHELSMMTIGWRLAVTLVFVLLNGFFVAAEFALVKVRGTRIEALAAQGSGSARATQHIMGHLDLYLSACQFGITVASLILGWLAEPAVATLLLALADLVGLDGHPGTPAARGRPGHRPDHRHRAAHDPRRAGAQDLGHPQPRDHRSRRRLPAAGLHLYLPAPCRRHQLDLQRNAPGCRDPVPGTPRCVVHRRGAAGAAPRLGPGWPHHRAASAPLPKTC